MKALSIRQPWAWLIVNGFKPVENRDWPTRFRGRFLIHASKGMTRMEYADTRDFAEGLGVTIPAFEELERGGNRGGGISERLRRKKRFTLVFRRLRVRS